MVTKDEVLALLPPFKNERILVTWRQSTNKLINEIAKNHERYEKDYDKFSYLFDNQNINSTCRGLWDFCKVNIPYTIETEDEQSVKSPAAILQPGEKTDCKHYALFIGGVLDSIRNETGAPWGWCYRFAGYSADEQIEHVFIVVKDGSKEIWIDPVLGGFDRRKQPTYFVDEEFMALYKISGIGDAPLSITVEPALAERNFLVMVNQNILSYKTLLRDNPDVTNGAFKAWYTGQGYDFNQLLLILKNG